MAPSAREHALDAWVRSFNQKATNARSAFDKIVDEAADAVGNAAKQSVDAVGTVAKQSAEMAKSSLTTVQASVIDTKRKAEAFVSRSGLLHGVSHDDAGPSSCLDMTTVEEPAPASRAPTSAQEQRPRRIGSAKWAKQRRWEQEELRNGLRRLASHTGTRGQPGRSEDMNAEESAAPFDLELFEPTDEEVALQRAIHASIWPNSGSKAGDDDTESSPGASSSSGAASSSGSTSVCPGEVLPTPAVRDEERKVAETTAAAVRIQALARALAAREWFAELEEKAKVGKTTSAVEVAILRIQALARATAAREQIVNLSGELAQAETQEMPPSPSKVLSEASRVSLPRSIGGA